MFLFQMKMNYRLKSKPVYAYRKTIIAIVAVVLFFIGITAVARTGVRTVSVTVARPVWLVRDFVGSIGANIRNYIAFQSTLVKENNALHTEIEALKLKEIDYDIITKENQELKSLLGRDPKSERVFARILSKPPRSPYDTMVLDVGTEQGVQLGDKVYLSGNVIIGLVTHLTSHTALVTLFSNGDQKQGAVLERTGATYELVGKGAENMVLEVPKDTDVLWGDVFVYPALTPSIIGSVQYIDTSSQSSFKTVYIRFPGNVFSAKWVFVEQSS
jgi:cell shape-determining protein MreC